MIEIAHVFKMLQQQFAVQIKCIPYSSYVRVLCRLSVLELHESVKLGSVIFLITLKVFAILYAV